MNITEYVINWKGGKLPSSSDIFIQNQNGEYVGKIKRSNEKTNLIFSLFDSNNLQILSILINVKWLGWSYEILDEKNTKIADVNPTWSWTLDVKNSKDEKVMTAKRVSRSPILYEIKTSVDNKISEFKLTKENEQRNCSIHVEDKKFNRKLLLGVNIAVILEINKEAHVFRTGP